MMSRIPPVTMRFVRRLPAQSYRRWKIEFENAPRPFACETYEPSVCFGRLLATHESAEGIRVLVQPLWLSFRQLVTLKTPLAKASALDAMLSAGGKMIRGSIDRWYRKELKIDAQRPRIDYSKWENRNSARFTV